MDFFRLIRRMFGRLDWQSKFEAFSHVFIPILQHLVCLQFVSSWWTFSYPKSESERWRERSRSLALCTSQFSSHLVVFIARVLSYFFFGRVYHKNIKHIAVITKGFFSFLLCFCYASLWSEKKDVGQTWRLAAALTDRPAWQNVSPTLWIYVLSPRGLLKMFGESLPFSFVSIFTTWGFVFFQGVTRGGSASLARLFRPIFFHQEKHWVFLTLLFLLWRNRRSVKTLHRPSCLFNNLIAARSSGSSSPAWQSHFLAQETPMPVHRTKPQKNWQENGCFSTNVQSLILRKIWRCGWMAASYLHHFLNQLRHFCGPPSRHITAWHDEVKDEGLPLKATCSSFAWSSLYFNVPTLEHEQDKFRAPEFWALANKNPFITSMFLPTLFEVLDVNDVSGLVPEGASARLIFCDK